mgnify:CR=1 FL=1
MNDILTYRESVFKVVVGIDKRYPVTKEKLVSFVLYALLTKLFGTQTPLSGQLRQY